jgi:hypothetical protein
LLNLKVNHHFPVLLLLALVMLLSTLMVATVDRTLAAGSDNASTQAKTTKTESGAPADTTANSQASSQGLSGSKPEDVIQFLKDSDTAMDELTRDGRGVRLHENFSLSVEGEMKYATFDSMIAPPDQIRLWGEIHEPGNPYDPYGSGNDDSRFEFEAIITGGIFYVRPGFSQKWVSASIDALSDLSDFDDDWEDVDFEQYVINPEYLGRETMPNGVQVEHIRFSWDAVKLTEEIERHVKPDVCQKAREELDKLKSSTMTEEVWVGVHDKLLYQASDKFLNTDLMIAYDDVVLFSNWGEQMNISAPPAEDVIPVEPPRRSSRCPEDVTV